MFVLYIQNSLGYPTAIVFEDEAAAQAGLAAIQTIFTLVEGVIFPVASPPAS